MSKNGGFLDVIWGDLISRRGLSLQPHPKQIVLEGIATSSDGIMSPVVKEHEHSCWQCHPEHIPEMGEEAVSIRIEGELEPRFWKTTLDGEPCGLVKEAKSGPDGYVWLARTPPHACGCGSGYTCTAVLRGNVTVKPDGNQ